MLLAQLAKEFKSRMILIHVYESPVIFTEASIAVSQEIETSIISDFTKRIENLKNDLLKKNTVSHIETRVVKGFLIQEICNCAQKEDADAIIMGTTGKGKAERVLLGSTSAKVISEAKCPVLLIPENTIYAGINKIVFATDLNEDNLTAAKQIVPFAKHFKSEIVFVFVDDKTLFHSDDYISNMSKKIRSHVNYNRISGYVSENTTITKGLEYFVKKHPADLLVMFKHNWHFPKSFLNPSVTSKMSNLTKIPLLSLPIESQILAEV